MRPVEQALAYSLPSSAGSWGGGFHVINLGDARAVAPHLEGVRPWDAAPVSEMRSGSPALLGFVEPKAGVEEPLKCHQEGQ